MTYTVSTDNKVPLALCESNETMSVLQNVALICSTKQGTCPGYREFGLPMNFIGRPFIAAQTLAASEIADALSEFETRASLVSVQFAGADDYTKMNISVEVEV